MLIGFEDEGPADLELKATEQPDEVAATPIRPTSAISLLASVLLHAAVLLALIHGPTSPRVNASPVPVRLVIVQPAAALHSRPPPLTGPPAEVAIAATAFALPPAPVQQRSVDPLPAQPVPRLAPQHVAVAAEPARRTANRPGPDATRAQYLAYLVMLTRRHLGLLPMSLVGRRQGETVLNLLVHSDGTIDRLLVAHSSGYPDIDARIEQMIMAVRGFRRCRHGFASPLWS